MLPGMDRNSLLWAVVVFFGATLVFGFLQNVTEGESAGVRLGVQLGALALILAAITAFVRWRR